MGMGAAEQPPHKRFKKGVKWDNVVFSYIKSFKVSFSVEFNKEIHAPAP